MLRFRYPRFSNWILCEYKGNSQWELYHGIKKKTYLLDNQVFWFAQRLDGNTDPYRIDPSFSNREIEKILDFLQKEGLTRIGRRVSIDGSYSLLSLYIPKNQEPSRAAPRLINGVLLCLFLPILISCGQSLFVTTGKISFSWVGFIFGCVSGVLLHEIGHAVACLAFGGFVYEGGIGIRRIIPVAYIMLEEQFIKNRFKRAQIDAAGIEMNFLLAGAYAGLATGTAQSFFFSAATINMMLGFSNLMPCPGLDGFNILLDFFGKKRFKDKRSITSLSQETERFSIRNHPPF